MNEYSLPLTILITTNQKVNICFWYVTLIFPIAWILCKLTIVYCMFTPNAWLYITYNRWAVILSKLHVLKIHHHPFVQSHMYSSIIRTVTALIWHLHYILSQLEIQRCALNLQDLPNYLHFVHTLFISTFRLTRCTSTTPLPRL